jgi:putative ABC transport system permease protein
VLAPFRYVGVANEFPTAPRDSFLVANASYLASVTGDDSVSTFLVDAGGRADRSVTEGVRAAAGPGATVTALSTAVSTIGSSLSAIDLHGLTLLELGFSFALGASAGGLVLALGMTERRRTFAVIRALGATPRQTAAFVVGEAGLVLVAGLVLGAALGGVLSRVLVSVLSGVFDPPPSSLAVPWTYLTLFAAAVVGSFVVACAVVLRWSRRAAIASLREGG